MSLKPDDRSRLSAYADTLTGLCLRFAAVVLIVAALFLVLGALTGKLQGILKMPAGDREQMISVVELAARAVVCCGAAVVVCVLLRLFGEEAVGQSLTIGGLLLYFGSPWFFVSLAGLDRMGGTVLPRTIVDAFRTLGMTALLPGLVLLLRDAILRVWTGISARRDVESRSGKDERAAAGLLASCYPRCWEMGFCRELVRRVCPAYERRKSCWKLGLGCYCDEQTILRAHRDAGPGVPASGGAATQEQVAGAARDRLSRTLRKSRCRNCVIYSEHQVQKYRLVSPLVFPAVIAVLWAFRERISEAARTVIMTTDRFMCCLAYKTGAAAPTMAETSGLMVGLAFVWLAIVMISYALRLLEYLIFELQV